MRGVKITDAQLETIFRVYGETSNACEAARQAGVSEATVRGHLTRADVARARERHARLCEQGLRASRKSIKGLGAKVEEFIELHLGTNSLEPRDLAALVKARADLASTLAKIADREDRRKSGVLERKKLRAELSGELVQKHEVTATARVVVLPPLDNDDDGDGALAREPGAAE